VKVMLLSGGNTIHTPRWANGLVAAGVEVVCASQHAFMPQGWDERVQRVRLPHAPALGYFTNGAAVARLFAEHGCDLLNAHYATGYGLLAWRSGVRPCLLSVWGSDV
jgi:L-malate glycosyltransferase